MSTTQHRRFLLPTTAAALLLTLAACAAPTGQPPGPVPPATAAPDPANSGGHESMDGGGPPVLYAVQSAALGVVATDGSGRLMYRSDSDSADPSSSNCTGACTKTWIPVAAAAAGQEPVLLGVDPALVGSIERSDGTVQLTLAGWPLYRHRDDDGTLGSAGRHGADGTWFAVTPTGDKASIP